MPSRTPPRPTARPRSRALVATLLVVCAAVAAPRAYRSLAPSSATAASPVAVTVDAQPAPPATAAPIDVPRGELPIAESSSGGPLGVAGGAVPDGTTVFDDGVPGVARLDRALLGALRRAATDAASQGVEIHVDSGWRSAAYQAQLLREAIVKYGSAEEAARWVATPETSAHVSGDAVDVGHAAATAWLSRHGSRYGLCQTYRNERWHYELRTDAVEHGCPRLYADPTEDPRMNP